MPSLSTSSTQQPSPVRNLGSSGGGNNSMDEGNSPIGISATSNITWENETNYSADSPIPPHLASTSLMSSSAYQQQNQQNYYQHSIYETETSSATTSARSSGIIPSSARSSGVIPSSARSSGVIARTIPGLSALSLDGTGGRVSFQSNNSYNSNSNNNSNSNTMFSGLNELKANSRIYQEQQLLFIMQNHFISIPIPSLRFDRIGSFSWNGINTLLYDFDDLQKSCHHINNFYLIDENKLKSFLIQHHLMRNPHSNAVSSNDEDFMNTFKFVLPENSSMTLGLNSSLEKV
jgi:hypothetical protein